MTTGNDSKSFVLAAPPSDKYQLLIQYFYEGLLPMDRSMIDASSGGALMDKTLEAAQNLIANMAADSQ